MHNGIKCRCKIVFVYNNLRREKTSRLCRFPNRTGQDFIHHLFISNRWCGGKIIICFDFWGLKWGRTLKLSNNLPIEGCLGSLLEDHRSVKIHRHLSNQSDMCERRVNIDLETLRRKPTSIIKCVLYRETTSIILHSFERPAAQLPSRHSIVYCTVRYGLSAIRMGRGHEGSGLGWEWGCGYPKIK